MRKPSTQRIAGACARHPWAAIGIWIALIVLSLASVAVLLPGSLTTEGKPTNNPESWRALHAYEKAFPADPQTTVSDIAVIRSDRYTVDSPRFMAFVLLLFKQAAATDAVAGAHNWYDSHDPALVSKDRHALIVPLLVTDDGAGDLLPVVERADRDPRFFVAVTGDETLDHDFNELSQHDLKTGELQFGLPAALIVLLLVFGAVVAGLVPLLMAIVSIIVALGLTALVAQPVELSVFIVNMLIAMGLALGIDYSLFVVSRYREERGHRRDKEAAIATAGATASRAVLFSGSTFVVAMFGMLIVPSSVMRSLAVGAILVGIVSVLGALTLLPALLGLIGDGVNRLRIPIIGSRSIEDTNVEGKFWGGVVTRVQRQPWISLGLATAILLAAASPVLGMHIGANSITTLPERFSSKQAFVELERDFPAATTDPVRIIVPAGHNQPAVSAALRNLQTQLGRDARFGPPAPIRISADGDAALLEVPVDGDPAGHAPSPPCATCATESCPRHSR